ncbi:hypothetical protein ACWDPV_06480 [Gordonia sp. NPDC003504]
MPDLALSRGIASAGAVDDDLLPESLARAGDIEEAIFWLPRVSEQGKQATARRAGAGHRRRFPR